MTEATQPSGPLRGLRVFDLTRVLAGPSCTQMLGDLGAEIIKIEKPGEGDDTRAYAPPVMPGTHHSAYYMAINRNKRSLALDISTPEGQEIARALIAQSDILVENFKTGTLPRYGLGWEDVRKFNPGMVFCSITGFGQTGPYASRPGYDGLVQAMSGLMSLTGPADGEPMRMGISVCDLFAGLHAAIGILAALHHRRETGVGQQVDISLLDASIAMLANQGMNYLATGIDPKRLGNDHPNIVPFRPFATADGHMFLTVGNDSMFRRFCENTGLSELASDPRFATNAQRVANRAPLLAVLEPVMRRHTTTWWVDRLEEWKIGGAPINRLSEVFADPHVQARGMVMKMPHPEAGEVTLLGSPFKLSETPPDFRLPPPDIGQHTDEILGDRLGLDEAALAGLRERGVIA